MLVLQMTLVKQLWCIGGADMNFTDTCGQTPMIISAICGYEKCLDTLIKAGADINAREMHGKIALIKQQQKDMLTQYINYYILGLICMWQTSGQTAFGDSARNGHNTCAAGELWNRKYQQYIETSELHVPDELNQSLCFKHICGEVIQKHLLHINPHLHLFNTIPNLRLPLIRK